MAGCPWYLAGHVEGETFYLFSIPAPPLPTHIPSTENGHKPHSSPPHRAEPSWAGPSRAEPNRADSSRKVPNRAETSRDGGDPHAILLKKHSFYNEFCIFAPPSQNISFYNELGHFAIETSVFTMTLITR